VITCQWLSNHIDLCENYYTNTISSVSIDLFWAFKFTGNYFSPAAISKKNNYKALLNSKINLNKNTFPALYNRKKRLIEYITLTTCHRGWLRNFKKKYSYTNENDQTGEIFWIEWIRIQSSFPTPTHQAIVFQWLNFFSEKYIRQQTTHDVLSPSHSPQIKVHVERTWTDYSIYPDQIGEIFWCQVGILIATWRSITLRKWPKGQSLSKKSSQHEIWRKSFETNWNYLKTEISK